jgi:hypothetical protein
LALGRTRGERVLTSTKAEPGHIFPHLTSHRNILRESSTSMRSSAPGRQPWCSKTCQQNHSPAKAAKDGQGGRRITTGSRTTGRPTRPRIPQTSIEAASKLGETSRLTNTKEADSQQDFTEKRKSFYAQPSACHTTVTQLTTRMSPPFCPRTMPREERTKERDM